MTLSRNTIFFSIVVLMLFVLNVIFTHNSLTAPYPGHNDFLSRWEAARSYWVDGLNPYGAEASQNIQQSIYGRTATDTEDPGFFAYPFYTVFLLLPLVFTNYAWASAIWMVLLEVCLIVSLILIINHFNWRPSLFLLGALMVWTVISYFPARGLILGQPGLLIYLLEVFAIWALAHKNDRWAGITLAVSTIKPQMGYLIVPFLMLWALRERRWNFFGSFVATFAVLIAASFALQPSWMTDWLAQVSIYTSYTQIGGPAWVISNWLWMSINPRTGIWEVVGGYGHWIELLISGSLYAYLGWLWYQVLWLRKQERFMWTVVMTLTITHLVAPRTASPHFVVFIIPMLFYFRHLIQQYGEGRGTIYSLVVLAILFIQGWLHFLFTVEGEFEHPTIYLPIPILVFLLLILTRQLWWHDKLDRFRQITNT
ncbi:MAG: DUF2029 domain-containing protein [Chloroflexi bacterium]|nr:MAG: DUF2029 domain-containing protein [Chloroflexota bacterium]MBL1193055.1 DUF2029 domain-containing protein [Chloroflexota bacterium]NOH10348.1 DUF2029 domain-containing protein [Chloroflexota bacterium]